MSSERKIFAIHTAQPELVDLFVEVDDNDVLAKKCERIASKYRPVSNAEYMFSVIEGNMQGRYGLSLKGGQSIDSFEVTRRVRGESHKISYSSKSGARHSVKTD
tara:strand:- start:45 stop:356 length:312 start_codon:yes stop_codon:yes gene_type:complete